MKRSRCQILVELGGRHSLLKSQPGMPSGPVALDGYRPHSFLKTDCSDSSKVLPGTGWMESLGVKGVKVLIGDRKAWLIVLAMSTRLGEGWLGPQTMC